jgi:short subunit dehydrogenase-like uncharacterized protein
VPIAVYGASGYQGKLVLAELAARGLTPILVGRDRARLAAAGRPGAEVRIAALGDHEALVAAFRDADAVINCAGPFTGTGHQVIRAALAARTPYVDTTGEQEFLKSVFDTFAASAELAGVSIVAAANDGCLPIDLVAHELRTDVRRTDRMTLTHVIVGGGPSRGSLRSALGTIDALTSGGLTYFDGGWRAGVPAMLQKVTLPGAAEPTEVARLPLCEVVTIPRHVPVGHVESFVEATVSRRLSTPIPPEIIDTLPDGPSAEARAGQRFTYLVDVWRGGEPAVRGVVEGVDTYGTTAAIAVEAARRLAVDGARPGVLAPAQAFDAPDFLGFLDRVGLRWWVRRR